MDVSASYFVGEIYAIPPAGRQRPPRAGRLRDRKTAAFSAHNGAAPPHVAQQLTVGFVAKGTANRRDSHHLSP